MRNSQRAIPEAAHGTSSGYSYWRCPCQPCLDWKRAAKTKRVEHHRHNAAIIAKLASARLTKAILSDTSPAGGPGSGSPAAVIDKTGTSAKKDLTPDNPLEYYGPVAVKKFRWHR